LAEIAENCNDRFRKVWQQNKCYNCNNNVTIRMQQINLQYYKVTNIITNYNVTNIITNYNLQILRRTQSKNKTVSEQLCTKDGRNSQ
jgi:hypothetical protein